MTIWRMAFRDYPNGPSFWPECRRLGVAAITYQPVADVDLCQRPSDGDPPEWRALQPAQQGCLRHFVDDMVEGDTIYVKEGRRIVGRGTVVGPYRFEKENPIVVPNGECAYHHQRKVKWDSDFQPVAVQVGRPQITTLLRINPEDADRVEAAQRGRG